MSFGLRAIFPGAGIGLRGFTSSPDLPIPVRFNLPVPVSIRSLAAHQAIANEYQNLGGIAGRLGISPSRTITSPDGKNFVQDFRGVTCTSILEGMGKSI